MKELSLGLFSQTFDKSYERVASEENLSQSSLDQQNAHPLLGGRREHRFEFLQRVLPWLLAFTFACTTISLLIVDRGKLLQRPEEGKGFKTDFCRFNLY
jgi:hypothetical protein